MMDAAAPEPPRPDVPDPAAIDRFLAEAEAERAQLELELQVARDRLVVVDAGRRMQEAEEQAALAAITSVAEIELARLDEVHRRAIEAIRRAAVDEAAAIVASARGTAASNGGPATAIDR